MYIEGSKPSICRIKMTDERNQNQIAMTAESREKVNPQTLIPRVHKLTPRFRAFLRALDLIGVLVWLYVIIKLFVFDVDVYFVERFFPGHSWLLNLRFIAIIGALALSLVLFKSGDVMLSCAYVISYPFIVCFWKIPRFIFKRRSWVLGFAFVNAVFTFFTGFKYNLITSAAFLIATGTIVGTSNGYLLWPAIAIISLILYAEYVQRFISTIKPSRIFSMQSKIVGDVTNFGRTTFALDETIRGVPYDQLTKEQAEKWKTNLQTSILFSRLCLFIARKLKHYQTSGVGLVSAVFIVIFLVMFTVFSFAIVNLGLYKIDHGSFAHDSTPSFFTFIYYSFNTVVFNRISDLVPIVVTTKISWMLEAASALFIGLIFASLILSIRRQKQVEELNTAIAVISGYGREVENFILGEYKFSSVDAALRELEQLKGVFVSFIYKLSASI